MRITKEKIGSPYIVSNINRKIHVNSCKNTLFQGNLLLKSKLVNNLGQTKIIDACEVININKLWKICTKGSL